MGDSRADRKQDAQEAIQVSGEEEAVAEQNIAARLTKVAAKAQKHLSSEAAQLRDLKEQVSTGTTPGVTGYDNRDKPGPISETVVGELPPCPAPGGSADAGGPRCSARGTMSILSPEQQLQDELKMSFGVFAADGRKRTSRGGGSQDAFTAIYDVLTHFGPSGALRHPHKSAPAQSSVRPAAPAAAAAVTKSSQPRQLPEPAAPRTPSPRQFHLFGVFDGHRSNHASRACAEFLASYLAAGLLAPGVLLPHRHAASASPDELAEEARRVQGALVAAVEKIDRQICSRRWVSVVRDNTKKFFPMHETEVPLDFDIEAWDISAIEQSWRQEFARLLQRQADLKGSTSRHRSAETEAKIRKKLEAWTVKRRELFPGTAVLAVLVDVARRKMYCANVGDCRAVLRDPQGRVLLLSRDHKPSLPGELARVCATQAGYVQIYGHRVTPENLGHWESVAKAARAQGKKAQYRISSDLALSRALGDKDLRKFGVVLDPEVKQHSLPQSQDPSAPEQILVLATDGVWDVLSSRQCMHLVSKAMQEAPAKFSLCDRARFAAQKLVTHAAKWTNDDVTAVVVVFNSRLPAIGKASDESSTLPKAE